MLICNWFRIYFAIRTIPECKELTSKLKELITYDITSVSELTTNLADSHYSVIQFSNGYALKAWNRNRFHSWLSRGQIIQPTQHVEHTWSYALPSRFVMFKLVQKILKFYKENNIRDSLVPEETLDAHYHEIYVHSKNKSDAIFLIMRVIDAIKSSRRVYCKIHDDPNTEYNLRICTEENESPSLCISIHLVTDNKQVKQIPVIEFLTDYNAKRIILYTKTPEAITYI